MQTFKTAIVVVLLLGVCYGAYVALNAPEPTLPDSLKDWNDEALALDVDNGSSVEIPQLAQTPTPGGLDSLAPPSVSPPTPAASAPTTSLSLPDTLASSANGKTPEVLTPPTLGGSTSSSSAAPKGNELPNLPDLPDLGNTKEGDSVPLAGTDNGPPIPSLGNTDLPGNADAPGITMPLLPGQGDAGSIASSNSFPSLPGSSSTESVPGGAKMISSKSSAKTALPFAQAKEQALKLANDSKLREALAMLSPYFNHLEVTEEEHTDLLICWMPWPLKSSTRAGIYSRTSTSSRLEIHQRALPTNIAFHLRRSTVSIVWVIHASCWPVPS